jgi:hypothetical protein
VLSNGTLVGGQALDKYVAAAEILVQQQENMLCQQQGALDRTCPTVWLVSSQHRDEPHNQDSRAYICPGARVPDNLCKNICPYQVHVQHSYTTNMSSSNNDDFKISTLLQNYQDNKSLRESHHERTFRHPIQTKNIIIIGIELSTKHRDCIILKNVSEKFSQPQIPNFDRSNSPTKPQKM